MTHSCVSDKVTGAEELLMRSGPCLQCMSQNATGQCRCRWRWPQIVRVLEFHSPRTVLCCWQNVEFGLVTANGTLRINIQPFWNAKPMELDHLSSSNPQQENHLNFQFGDIQNIFQDHRIVTKVLSNMAQFLGIFMKKTTSWNQPLGPPCWSQGARQRMWRPRAVGENTGSFYITCYSIQ